MQEQTPSPTAPPRPGPAPAAPTRAEFDRVYDAEILGRHFVEYPEYYALSRERYRRALERFAGLDIGPGARLLDIGGGQFAILAQRLLGCHGVVGDVTRRAEAEVRAAGLDFVTCDLMAEDLDLGEPFDAIVLLEVIEHLPVPPYVVFERLARALVPGGVLFLTTPNGYRIRNVLYMLANRRILDRYRYPGPGEAMGHQAEYTLEQMVWQVERAGLELVLARQVDDGWPGASRGARIARRLTRVLDLVPHLRNGLALAARRPAELGAG